MSNLNKIKVKSDADSIKEQLDFYVENGFQVMLHGPSGVGKSRRVMETDPGFTSIVLRNGMLPEEVVGLTIYPDNEAHIPNWYLNYLKKSGEESDIELYLKEVQKANKEDSGIWIAPPWYEELCKKCEAEPNKKHILFIDEITNVRPTVQSLVFHIVLKGSIGPNLGVLPKNAVVVCAGNSMKDSISAYPMPEPLFRRFYGHLNIELDFDSFKKWGMEKDSSNPNRQKIHPIILSFLERKIPETSTGKKSLSTSTDTVFYSRYDEANGNLYAIDPRGWEQISKVIYESNGELCQELLENKLGSSNAMGFLAYVRDVMNIKNYDVRIKDARMSVAAQMRFYVENSMSFMLHGASGIGKTRRVEEIDPDLTSIVLRNGQMPEEIIGKTRYPSGIEEIPKWHEKYKNKLNKESDLQENSSEIKGVGVWVAPPWYEELCEKCKAEPLKNHILFIDELTNVRPAEQSMVYHLILNRSIGPNIGVLPKNVVVVAAGNSISESTSAFDMPEPLYRRFAGHIYLKQDVQEWIDWASKTRADGRKNIHPAILSFVSMKREKVFYSPYDSEVDMEFAIDPRGWEQLSDMFYACDGEISHNIIINKLGKELGTDFISTLNDSMNAITVESIVNNTYSQEDIPKTISKILPFIYSLASQTKIENVEIIRNFIATQLNVGNGEGLRRFDSIWANLNQENAIYLASKQKQEKGMY